MSTDTLSHRDRILTADHSPGHNINPEAIPEGLTSVSRWICWDWERKANGRWSKEPFQTNGQWHAKTDTPSTWTTFGTATEGAERNGMGLGFVFDADGLVGIDLDSCRDPDTGILTEWAEPIVRRINSYTEVSPSGTGVKIFVRGNLTEQKIHKIKHPDGGEAEFFWDGKFFTVTGQRQPGTPADVCDRHDELNAVYQECLTWRQRTTPPAAQTSAYEPSDDRTTALEALGVIPNSPGLDYDDYLAVGMALHSVDPSDSMCAEWDAWSRGSDKYAEGEQRRRWRSFGGTGYGIGTLIKMANDTGRTWRTTRQRSAATPNAGPQGHHNPLFEIDDPRRLAKRYLTTQLTSTGDQRLTRWNASWLRYDSHCYLPVDDESLRSTVTNFIQREFEADAAECLRRFELQRDTADGDKKPPRARKVKAPIVTDVMHHTAALALIPSTTVQPSWLRDQPNGFDPRATIVAQNGIVNLQRLVSGDPHYLVPPTPNYFSTTCLPLRFCEDATEPTEWLRFLDDLWADDPDSIACLQEWFGLLLVPDTRFQKILLVVGPLRSGKGTIARVIRALIGESNVAGPTLAGIATNFGLWPLIGKPAAIIADARLSAQTDAVTVAERLLSISGEDGITIDRKNLAPITTTLSTRFVLMTNELPRLSDASGALASRFIILRMVNSFLGQEDHGLTERLMGELPGILTWAIAGWQRLTEQRRFTIPDSSIELVQQLEDSSSPMGAFVRECCDVGSSHEIDKGDLFGAWKSWCEAENRAHPGTAATFAIQLRAVVPSLGGKRAKLMGARIQRFTGIKLKGF